MEIPMRRALPCVLLFVTVLSFAQTEDALQAYRDGDYEDALRITQDELEANPNNVESHVVRGWTLSALGRNQEALDIGLRGLQISQYDHRLIQIVAEANLSVGSTLVALEYLELYVRVAPTASRIDWVYAAMGEILIGFGEYHRADIALTASVYHAPRNAARWARLGYAREQVGDWEEALEAYDRALQLSPGLGDAVRGRSRVQSHIPG
jgi:tetratricopeptide (TPR) repeat protein